MIVTAVSVLLACKNDAKKEDTTVPNDTVEVFEADTTSQNHPAALTSVFAAHGGWNTWSQMNNLCFEIDGKGGTETHTIDLRNRKTKIEHKDWSIGYDGDDVWVLQNKEDAYQGNARFYHNLMFYFYAMPYILGDAGIIYTEMEPTELAGKTYNPIKVGYKAGVGDSPEDEYILYFDPETNKMSWLGYTVTYRTSEKSNTWHFIKYDQWQEVNGLLLPSKLTWYNVANNKPTDERNDRRFDKVTVSSLKLDADVFAKPEGATVVPR
ncbi:MAG: hypothetical protein CMC70_12635 [Flavobacteriaceae bacterium]|nr:hypothetical protein [Flavobacteriaceae bacterium]